MSSSCQVDPFLYIVVELYLILIVCPPSISTISTKIKRGIAVVANLPTIARTKNTKAIIMKNGTKRTDQDPVPIKSQKPSISSRITLIKMSVGILLLNLTKIKGRTVIVREIQKRIEEIGMMTKRLYQDTAMYAMTKEIETTNSTERMKEGRKILSIKDMRDHRQVVNLTPPPNIIVSFLEEMTTNLLTQKEKRLK